MREKIESAWKNQELLKKSEYQEAVRTVVAQLDEGELRVAEPKADGTWQVNEWIKKAVVMYFPIQKMETIEVGPLEFHDKIALKTNYKDKRLELCLMHAIWAFYVAKGVIMMPSYINIGAYVDSGTMVDTWATVGSCAQIGKNVHLSGGVGIGGVLNPCKQHLLLLKIMHLLDQDV